VLLKKTTGGDLCRCIMEVKKKHKDLGLVLDKLAG